jgi:transcription elongation factor GreB
LPDPSLGCETDLALGERRPITPQGFQRFQDELHSLWHQERPRVVQEVADAAAQGDRSENAEYIYGKKRLREIDRRIRYLSELIDKLQVVEPSSMRADHVRFGATVEVTDEEGNRRVYRIVGEDEVDAGAGRISMKSPVGKALLKKKVGEVALIVRPAGELEVELVAIRYE